MDDQIEVGEYSTMKLSSHRLDLDDDDSTFEKDNDINFKLDLGPASRALLDKFGVEK